MVPNAGPPLRPVRRTLFVGGAGIAAHLSLHRVALVASRVFTVSSARRDSDRRSFGSLWGVVSDCADQCRPGGIVSVADAPLSRIQAGASSMGISDDLGNAGGPVLGLQYLIDRQRRDGAAQGLIASRRSATEH